MLRTKGFSASAVIVAGVAARTNAMESHRTTERARQEYVRGAATRMQPVPNGLIHDWIGAVFTPNAIIDGLLSVVRDYSRYKDYLQSGGFIWRIYSVSQYEERDGGVLSWGIPSSVRWLVNPVVKPSGGGLDCQAVLGRQVKRWIHSRSHGDGSRRANTRD